MPQANEWGDKLVQSAHPLANEWGDAPAGAQQPHIPDDFGPGDPSKPQGFWHDMIHHVLPQTILGKMGGTDIAQGVDTMRQPGVDPKLQGAHQILTGASKMAAPLALPYALAEPAAALTTLGAGILGQKVGSTAAQAFGATPGASDLIGDAAGLATGGLANKITPSSDTLRRLWAIRGNPDVRDAAIDLIPGSFGTKFRKVRNAIDVAGKALEDKNAAPAAILAPPPTGDSVPSGVNKELWNKLSPEHRAKVREAMQGPSTETPVNTSAVPLNVPPPPGAEPSLPGARDYTGYRGKYEIDPEDFAAARRGKKSLDWADYLSGKGINEKDLGKLNWTEHAKQAGLHVPNSQATINQIRVLMRDKSAILSPPPQ